jgi:hypothetical protein
MSYRFHICGYMHAGTPGNGHVHVIKKLNSGAMVAV